MTNWPNIRSRRQSNKSRLADGFGRERANVDNKDPLDITGVVAWWTADLGITLQANNKVSQWVDRKNAIALVQATDASRPEWQPHGYNGAPCVAFDGTADQLSVGSYPGAIPSGTNPSLTMGVVQQDTPASDATTRYICAYGGTTANDTRGARRSQAAGPVNRFGGIQGNGSASISVNHGVFDGRAAFCLKHASPLSAQIDGQTPSTTTDNGLNTGTSNFRLGALQYTSSGFWLGKIRDIIIVNPATLEAGGEAFLKTWLQKRRLYP